MIKEAILIRTLPITEHSRLILVELEKMIDKDSKRQMYVTIIEDRYLLIVFREREDIDDRQDTIDDMNNYN